MIHSNQILHGDQIRREELLGSTTPPSLEGGVAWILLRDLYAVANIPVPYVVYMFNLISQLKQVLYIYYGAVFQSRKRIMGAHALCVGYNCDSTSIASAIHRAATVRQPTTNSWYVQFFGSCRTVEDCRT